jgi:mannan endo-1,6-alpha-mannosidase
MGIQIWDWETRYGLITPNYAVKDGIGVNDAEKTCQDIYAVEFTYNMGLFLHGSAVMYNFTGNNTWKDRTNGFLNRTEEWFLNDTVTFEPGCEPYGTCAIEKLDILSFKSYLLRFLAATTQVAPWTFEPIIKMISATADAAVKVCTAKFGTEFKGVIFRGIDGTGYRYNWVPGSLNRGQVDVGSHMNALSAVMYNLVQKVKPPATSDDRGTSEGNPTAGRDDDSDASPPRNITTADKAGAGILTARVVGGIIGGSVWISM